MSLEMRERHTLSVHRALSACKEQLPICMCLSKAKEIDTILEGVEQLDKATTAALRQRLLMTAERKGRKPSIGTVGDRVLEWLLLNPEDRVAIIFDMRLNNGADGDRYQHFWDTANEMLEASAGARTVHERRHGYPGACVVRSSKHQWRSAAQFIVAVRSYHAEQHANTEAAVRTSTEQRPSNRRRDESRMPGCVQKLSPTTA